MPYDQFDTFPSNARESAERSFAEWAGPVIFVGQALLDHKEYLIAVAINVISDLASERIGLGGGNKNAKIDIIVERSDGSCEKLHYEGPADGLKEIAPIVKKRIDMGENYGESSEAPE